MATLSPADRAALNADIMRSISQDGAVAGMTKADWLSALGAADDWINTNAASFNTALPLPFRTNATASQKARLLMWVVSKRYGAGL